MKMGHNCCSKQKVKRGLWSPEEDEKLIRYITTHGHGCWSSVPKHAGTLFKLLLLIYAKFIVNAQLHRFFDLQDCRGVGRVAD